MSLFFRDAVRNIWEWNVMMSGIDFRIVLQKKKRSKNVKNPDDEYMGIHCPTLSTFIGVNILIRNLFQKLWTGKETTGTPASMRRTG